MLDLEFFKKKFCSEKNFLLQNSCLSDVDYISTVFYLGSYWGGVWGELRLSHFSEIFDFFTNFLNLIMHIGGPLSFRLVSSGVCNVFTTK